MWWMATAWADPIVEASTRAKTPCDCLEGVVVGKQLKDSGRDDVLLTVRVRNACASDISGFMAMVQLRSIDDQVTTSRSVYSSIVTVTTHDQAVFPWSMIVWDRRQDVWLAAVRPHQMKTMWEPTFLVYSDGTTASCPSALPNDALTIDDKPTTILRL